MHEARRAAGERKDQLRGWLARLGWTAGHERAGKRWVLTLLIGLLTGLVAVLLTFCTRTLLLLKVWGHRSRHGWL